MCVLPLFSSYTPPPFTSLLSLSLSPLSLPELKQTEDRGGRVREGGGGSVGTQ